MIEASYLSKLYRAPEMSVSLNSELTPVTRALLGHDGDVWQGHFASAERRRASSRRLRRGAPSRSVSRDCTVTVWSATTEYFVGQRKHSVREEQ